MEFRVTNSEHIVSFRALAILPTNINLMVCKEFPSHSDIDVVLHSNLKHLQLNFFGALPDDREKRKKTYLADRLFKVCT